MFKKLCVAAAVMMMLAASGAYAGPVDKGDRKDFQIFKDVATSVERYTRFTIFDDVSANVTDGVVTLTGKVTMPYKRDDIEARRQGRRPRRPRSNHGAAGFAVRRRVALDCRSIYNNSISGITPSC
jgi:hypothetical protein